MQCDNSKNFFKLVLAAIASLNYKNFLNNAILLNTGNTSCTFFGTHDLF